MHPGFIDGHYHAGLHLSRGSITDDPNPPKEEGGGTGVFTRWINAVTDEDEYASALMASAELARNGFTGFVDAATSFCPGCHRRGGRSRRHSLLACGLHALGHRRRRADGRRDRRARPATTPGPGGSSAAS